MASNSLVRRGGAGAETTRSSSRAASAGYKAYRNTVLETVRSGAPSQIMDLIAQLVSEKHIVPEDLTQKNEAEDGSLLDLETADIEMRDEDDLPDESPDEKEDNEIRPDEDPGSQLDKSEFPVSDSFELLVIGNRCELVRPGWVGSYKGKTDVGASVLTEAGWRFKSLSLIAEWLTWDREKFLEEPSSWTNLGPKDYPEICAKSVTVTQDSLRQRLQLGTDADMRVVKSTFSRYMSSTRIVWPTGGMNLIDLFGKPAREGWVAKSIELFMVNAGRADIKSGLEKYKDVTTSKPVKDRLSSIKVEHMNLGQFIVFANLSAQTSWASVYNTYFLSEANKDASR